MKKVIKVNIDTHDELQKLKIELHNKTLGDTIDYLLYELNKRDENE